MERADSTLPSSKPDEAVPENPTMQQTTITIANNASQAPFGYKIVKVRKPDGTIIKVRRPVASTVGNEPISTPPSSSPKPISKSTKGHSPLPGSLPELPLTNLNSGGKSLATEVSGQATTENASGVNPAKGPPTKVTTPEVHASKLETTGKSYRLYRRFHRVHNHASRFVQAFDPYSDVGDLEGGDEYISDDYEDDDVSEESDAAIDDERSHATGSGDKSKESPGNHAGLNAVGRSVAQRGGSAPKQAKTDISVCNVPIKESTSTMKTDPVVQEKELLDTNSPDAALRPQRLPRSLSSRSSDWAKLTVWMLMVLLPVLFIILGLCTATLYKKEYPSTRGYIIGRATKFAITAWPIIFAAIAAQALKTLATYQVERGIRLMTLEQLISSHSVASAIKQPFVLRRINWITLGLVALWGLSPLGSQAMQYTTSHADNMVYELGNISYLNTAQDNVALQQGYNEKEIAVAATYSDSMDVLFAAVFQPLSQYQPDGSDPWGNPLVPVYENLLLDYSPDSEGWIKISDDLGRDSAGGAYSSYYGIPLANFDEYDGTWNFTMRSSYLHFECPPLALLSLDELAQLGENITDFPSTINGSLSMEIIPPIASLPGSLTFISQCSGQENAVRHDRVYTVCNLTQTFVDSDVGCSSANCTVHRIKLAPQQEPTSIDDFAEVFLKSSDTGLEDFADFGDSIYSITELYLQNPFNATEPGVGVSCDLSSLDVETFTNRLSYLINTFYSTGFTHDFELGSVNSSQNVTIYGPDGDTAQVVSLTANTTGKHHYQDASRPQIYVISWQWVVIFECCALVLLLVAIASVLLEAKTISPDVLGFASSIARHSRYVKLPETDGTMSGAEKARALGASVVMMQDVRPTAEVGKIVLGSASSTAQRLRQGRLYR